MATIDITKRLRVYAKELQSASISNTELRMILSQAADEIEELRDVCSEAYCIAGIVLDDAGQLETRRAAQWLDNLAQHKMVHKDLLPWMSGKESSE